MSYMFKICVVTGTRAEYHLLMPLMKLIKDDSELNLLLVVTGAHLDAQYGETYIDIEKDGFEIDYKIPILTDDDSESGINLAMSNAILGLNKVFKNNRIDMLILLGDRYELLSAAIVAMNYKVPICHLHGGETTEGAIDECIRHVITKMSYLHFTSCEQYRNRVIQLGENPERVYNVGAFGLDNINTFICMSKEEISESLNFDLGERFAVFTYHPVTLGNNEIEQEMKQILDALDSFKELQVIFTKSNADANGRTINRIIEDYCKNSHKSVFVSSLGMQRYLSCLRNADIVIGNSSSGIIETPSFGIPTINIGDRQKGRIQGNNIINCKPEYNELVAAIKKALSKEFIRIAKTAVNPYGYGGAATKCVSILKRELKKGIDLKKTFFDINIGAEYENN